MRLVNGKAAPVHAEGPPVTAYNGRYNWHLVWGKTPPAYPDIIGEASGILYNGSVAGALQTHGDDRAIRVPEKGLRVDERTNYRVHENKIYLYFRLPRPIRPDGAHNDCVRFYLDTGSVGRTSMSDVTIRAATAPNWAANLANPQNWATTAASTIIGRHEPAVSGSEFRFTSNLLPAAMVNAVEIGVEVSFQAYGSYDIIISAMARSAGPTAATARADDPYGPDNFYPGELYVDQYLSPSTLLDWAGVRYGYDIGASPTARVVDESIRSTSGPSGAWFQ